MFALLSRVSESDFLIWGWRIPFLISIVLVGVGLYIRLQLKETPVFREIEAKKEVARVPLVEILTRHRRPFFTAVGLKLSEISYATIGTVFAISYVKGKLAMPRSVIINASCSQLSWRSWRSASDGSQDRLQDNVPCKLPVCDGFRFPDVLCCRHEGPADHHVNDHRGDHLRQMVFGVGAPWYSELFTARLRYSGASSASDRRGDQRRPTPFVAATFMARPAARHGRFQSI
jgi:MHS family shikimate/dehydroshikimate transporter-like MFS transporter